MDLYEELIAAVTALHTANIPYALVGGLAYSLWVEPRATEDIDFLILPSDWPRVIQAMEPLGWLQLAGDMDFQNIRIRRLTKLQDIHAMVADYLLADGDLATAVAQTIPMRYKNTQIHVARPEAIICLKQGRMSAKDTSDIAGLTKLIGGQS